MNWQDWQITTMIECKRTEWEEFESVSCREHIVSSDVKWRRVQSNLRDKNVVADVSQIRNKWEGILGWYKAVKDWNNQSGNPSYESLSRADMKLAKLPLDFKESWGDLLDTFYGRRASFAPPCLSESAAPNAEPAPSNQPNSPEGCSSVPQTDESVEGETTGGTTTGGKRPPGPSRNAPSRTNLPQSGISVQGNSGIKGKKNMSVSATAIQDAMSKLSKSIVDVEKTREEREHAKLTWIKEAEDRRLEVQSSVSDSLGLIARAMSNFVDKFPARET